MKFQEAIKILSQNVDVDRYEAAVKVAQSVATQFLVEWAFNRLYNGFETVDDLEKELCKDLSEREIRTKDVGRMVDAIRL